MKIIYLISIFLVFTFNAKTQNFETSKIPPKSEKTRLKNSNTISSFATDINDSLALVAIYNATNGDNWRNNTNWLVGPVSTWAGITIENGRVKELDLHYNYLSGNIPQEIGNLLELNTLNLSGNEFSGSMPAEIGNLTKLTRLELSGNNLSDDIPAEIGNLSTLTWLDLSNNQLQGSVPVELNLLTLIKYLYLSRNQLNDLPDLSALTQLEETFIGYNNFDFGDLEIANINS